MDDKTYIRLVYSHAESIGGHNDRCLPFHPTVLCNVAFFSREAGMIVGGRDAVVDQEVGCLACAATVTDVDDATAPGFADDAQ